MTDKSNEERLTLIRENLAEVLNPEIIESALAEGRNPKIYWGAQTSLEAPGTRRTSATNSLLIF